jgi:hypothetical protein
MDGSSIWIWVVLGVVLVALVVMAVLTRSGMRKGVTPPGPPVDLHTDTHDEPVEHGARILDEKRHAHSPEDVGKAARDEDRLLGH